MTTKRKAAQKTTTRTATAKKEAPELTERQKFHKFFREVYTEETVDFNAPHHPDRHGMLGYETNVFKWEVFLKIENNKNIYKQHSVNGMCEYCSNSQQSAQQAYDSLQK